MSCTFVSVAHVNGTTAAITSGSIVVASGQSLVAYAHAVPGTAATVTSTVWNTSENFTQQGTSRFWILKNPTAGTHTVTQTWSADPAGRIGVTVWVVDNLDQTTVARTPTVAPTDPGSATGDLVLGGMTASFADTNTWAANASAVEDANAQTNAGSGSGSYWMVAEHEAGASGTTPMQFQHLTTDGNAVLRADFIALIGASGVSAVSGVGYYLRRRHEA